MKASADLSIGELAGHFGLAAHVLRHWESIGLLEPARDAYGRRRYGPGDITRVALIVMGKGAGFALPRLRELLSGDDPMDRPELLREHLRILEERIARASAARDLIEHALSCPLNFHECGHARERIAAVVEAGGVAP